MVFDNYRNAFQAQRGARGLLRAELETLYRLQSQANKLKRHDQRGKKGSPDEAQDVVELLKQAIAAFQIHLGDLYITEELEGAVKKAYHPKAAT